MLPRNLLRILTNLIMQRIVDFKAILRPPNLVLSATKSAISQNLCRLLTIAKIAAHLTLSVIYSLIRKMLNTTLG